jgi:hypothetical protein
MTFTRFKTTLSPHRTQIYYLIASLGIFFINYYLYKLLFKSQFVTNTISPNKTIFPYYFSSPINSNNYNNLSAYYRHATSSRNSSYPFISGDTFRAFSDYIYDETREDNLASVQYGDVIFVKADVLSKFFSSAFKSIPKPFVLITHNSDKSAPAQFKEHLSNSKIIMWYASNPSLQNHQKLSPIPIGLGNRKWATGNLDKFISAFNTSRKPWLQRTSLLYVNFDVRTNRIQREKALSQASKIPYVQIIKQRISFETYLEQIGNAKFVLSPPGNGLDCHRTWEAVLMGAVPIVLTSGLDPLFLKTRSIVIDDWSKLTQDFLLSFNFSLNDQLPSDVLYARYWREILLKHRKN